MTVRANITRRVNVDTLVTDQFPVVEADGFTKVTGLVQGSFATNTWLDGVEQPAVIPAITEIPTDLGDYYYTFTPNATGLWVVEISYLTSPNENVWRAHYDVPISGIITGQTFYDIVRDWRGNALPYVTVKVFQAGTSTLLHQTETDYRGEYSVPLTGAISSGLVDIEYSGGGIQTFTKDNARLQ